MRPDRSIIDDQERESGPAMTGFDVILIVVGLLVLVAAERYLAWLDFDRYRRLSRRAHRNLERGIR